MLANTFTPRKWGVGPFLCFTSNTPESDGCTLVGADERVHLSADGRATVDLAEMVNAISSDCLHGGIGLDDHRGKEFRL